MQDPDNSFALYPLIFLDIDGVLRTKTLRPTLRDCDGVVRWSYTPHCVTVLNQLTNMTQARLVISSTWRDWGITRFRRIATSWGITAPIVSITPGFRMDGQCRGQQIHAWIYKHYARRQIPPRIVILDDENDEFETFNLTRYWVQTCYESGLTDSCLRSALHILAIQGDDSVRSVLQHRPPTEPSHRG